MKLAWCVVSLILVYGPLLANETVKINDGVLRGSIDPVTKVRVFKGIPFAAPPIDNLRWQAPHPVVPWQGERDATQFANRPMQNPIFSDMQFRSPSVSEDSLYLNVWTPTIKPEQKLPVLLYFYGGGFIAGDSSEKRYDGTSMAAKDLVVVTANYRLGIFGFLAHPYLSAESDYHGSGNYSLLDQHAALQWVVENIRAFGGDPKRITIGGESAGSISVSALMASPLSKDMIAGAIGQSGSILGSSLHVMSLAASEAEGEKILKAVMGKNDRQSFQALRTMPAEELLAKVTAAGFSWFKPNIDGYFFPTQPLSIYQDAKQAQVPLLVGDNSQEGSYTEILAGQEPTVDNYLRALKRLYPKVHEQVAVLYPAVNRTQVKKAAQALASDRFMGFSTWNWIALASAGERPPSYYYFYDHVRPLSHEQHVNGQNARYAATGAVHSAEIEYALGNLDVNPLYVWQNADYQVSSILQQYFANFVKTGNPNGQGLVDWPSFSEGKRLIIDVSPHVEDMQLWQARYKFHRQYYASQKQ